VETQARLEADQTLLAGGDEGRKTMDAEPWQKIEQLYHAALERDVCERPAFLQQAWAGDHKGIVHRRHQAMPATPAERAKGRPSSLKMTRPNKLMP
jgi:hypothetical protein